MNIKDIARLKVLAKEHSDRSREFLEQARIATLNAHRSEGAAFAIKALLPPEDESK